jgi:hypothetical protein
MCAFDERAFPEIVRFLNAHFVDFLGVVVGVLWCAQ